MYEDTIGFQLEMLSLFGYIAVKEKKISVDLNMMIANLINLYVCFSPQPHMSK